MSDFNSNLPSNDKSVPELATDTRRNFLAVEERLSREHNFPDNASDAEKVQGRHAFFTGDQAACDAQWTNPWQGAVRFNTTLGAWEVYDGTRWVGTSAYIGEVRYLGYAPGALPWGWLACDGSQVPQGTYPELFARLGHVWTPEGQSNPTLNFFLPPPLRVPIIVDPGGAYGTAVGEAKGFSEITLTPQQVPPNESQTPGTDDGSSSLTAGGAGTAASRSDHVHVVDAHDHAPTADAPQPFDNKMPYMTLYGMIFSGV